MSGRAGKEWLSALSEKCLNLGVTLSPLSRGAATTVTTSAHEIISKKAVKLFGYLSKFFKCPILFICTADTHNHGLSPFDSFEIHGSFILIMNISCFANFFLKLYTKMHNWVGVVSISIQVIAKKYSMRYIHRL